MRETLQSSKMKSSHEGGITLDKTFTHSLAKVVFINVWHEGVEVQEYSLFKSKTTPQLLYNGNITQRMIFI